VSYALEFTRNARRRLGALPIEVQEAVLDVVDQIAADAATTGSSGAFTGHHTVRYRDDAQAFNVYVAVETDHAARSSPSLRFGTSRESSSRAGTARRVIRCNERRAVPALQQNQP
jgi:hypothetical protein